MSTKVFTPARLVLAVVAAVVVAMAGVTLFLVRRPSLPAPGTGAYEEVSGAFYRGLAALEVGLLEDAAREFGQATSMVPEEPAAWANLGLARLRLGDLEAAVEPIERALALAPDDPRLIQLAGRMEIVRGRLDEGLARLRRAVDADPQALRARFALAEEIERAAAPDADTQALALIDELAALVPDNAAVAAEQARLAAKLRDGQRLATAVQRLTMFASGPEGPAPRSRWPERALEQLTDLQAAAAAGDFTRALRSTTFLRNVLASVPSFREDLGAIRTPTELIAEPLTTFARLASAAATPSPPDGTLAFQAEPLQPPVGNAMQLLLIPGDQEPRVIAASESEVVSVSGAALRVPFPGSSGRGPTSAGLVAVDWNNDFRTDIALAGSAGLRLWIQQGDGSFVDSTPRDDGTAARALFGAWAADVEMDGDLDLVAAPLDGAAFVVRNNGDGTWTALSTVFAAVSDPRGFAWADLDGDADPDAAFLDAGGAVHVFLNRQAGDFVMSASPNEASAVALTANDIDADGSFDVIVLDQAGAIRRLTWRMGTWQREDIAVWQGLNRAAPGTHRLLAGDLDNNGAVDLVASGTFESRIWLGDAQRRLQGFQATPEGEVFAIAEMSGDGRLDLVARAGAPAVRGAAGMETRWQAVRHVNRGSAAYHWAVVRPRAQPVAGDQRINSFGVGGQIEVRSGLLFQKQVLTGGPVHIGLGDRTAVDVARIVWPNGVAQAEFGVDADETLVAEQRLKGSCPWVFAWDGERMAFVTDFLWRSPLGLRINAQDTAGVTQTEDWVRISGDRLAPREGRYDVRITAELWETHFFDHVSLMAVDHPAGSEVFVDERFSAATPPALAVHAVEGLRPVTRAWDHRGRDVTGVIARRDGRYLSAFEKGQYQGIAAEDHFVEFELDRPVATRGGRRLLATGWIYPTDSSINVAIGQGGRVVPRGVSLEAQDASGRWSVVAPDLGFPAGKDKTLVIDLSGAPGAHRFRLRTNLEISWDALAQAEATDAPLRRTRLRPSRAVLAFRGYSATTSPRGEAPEAALYDRVVSRGQRWRDLVGYHTRFGDVSELLADVDDRYVIMNAGDELQLLFDELPPPASGWRRDFVLIGDGWEKDGDYNTGFSQTVLPLPSHDRPDYGRGATSLELEDDPVYQRYKTDWERYHTRYIAPDRFVSGLRWAR